MQVVRSTHTEPLAHGRNGWHLPPREADASNSGETDWR
jgi:hypothetical protein